MYNSFEKSNVTRILSVLHSHKTQYLSGQDLSYVLKISRVAVWKHIRTIRTLGYKIESKPRLGYRLTQKTSLLLPWEIITGLKTKKLGKRAYFFDKIDSTQNFAMKISPDSKENGTIVISQIQTSGRGRMARKWISPSGGIWLSIIFHPQFDFSCATVFPLAASLALAKSIKKMFGIHPELKWPNDVTINGKKVSGMLVDLSIESNKIQSLVLGVGINYHVNAKRIDALLKNTPNFYGTTTLIEPNQSQNPVPFVQTFLYELEKVYDLLLKGKTQTIIKNWTKKSSTIGKKITVNASSGRISGKAIRIDRDGALVISKNNKTHRVIAGDITQKV